MAPGIHDYDDLTSIPRPGRRRQNVSHPLRDQMPDEARTFQGQEISEAEIETVEVLPAIRQIPAPADTAELSPAPETSAPGSTDPLIEEFVFAADPAPVAGTPTAQPEAEVVAEEESAQPGKQAIIRARQAAPTASTFLPIFDGAPDEHALSHMLTAMSHVQRGQLLMISQGLHDCPEYHGQASEFIRDLRDGETAKAPRTSRKKSTLLIVVVALLCLIFLPLVIIWTLLTRLLRTHTGIDIVPKFGALFPAVAAKLGLRRFDRDKSQEPVELDPETKAEINALVKQVTAKKGGTHGAHFESELRVVAAALADPDQEQAVGDDLDLLARSVTDHLSTGLVWNDTDAGIDTLIGIQPEEVDPPLLLSGEEVSALGHIPDDTTAPHGIKVARSGIKPLKPSVWPMTLDDPLRPPKGLLPMGVIDQGSVDQKFIAIENSVLDRHVMISGRTGTGKSVQLENFIYGIVNDDYPLILIDPHGQLVDAVIDMLITLTPERLADIAVLDLGDEGYVPALNPLDISDESEIHTASASFLRMLAYHTDFTEAGQPRAYNYADLALQALASANLHLPDSAKLSPLHVPTFFADPEFRHLVMELCSNYTVRLKFDPDDGEFEGLGTRFQQEHSSVIMRAFGALERSPDLALALATTNKLDFGQLIGDKKIVLCKLSKFKGDVKLGEMLARLLLPSLLGSMNDTGRVRNPLTGEVSGHGCRVVIDEAPAVINGDQQVMTILAEARKWDFGVILAMQFLDQLDSELRKALYANTGSKISLQLDPHNSAGIAKAISPNPRSGLTENDFAELPNFCEYSNIAVGQSSSGPFFSQTLPPISVTRDTRFNQLREQVLQQSRALLTVERVQAEQRLDPDLRVAVPQQALQTLLKQQQEELGQDDHLPPPLFPDAPGAPEDDLPKVASDPDDEHNIWDDITTS